MAKNNSSKEQQQQQQTEGKGKAPEQAGFDKKLDGPNRPSV
ncbi:spore protein [Paenibacillus pasadenensis]|nr:spore protein [Paenibacillus pasadenensis]MCM3748684.1 spore protein [Paenibacillus pasadenensis]